MHPRAGLRDVNVEDIVAMDMLRHEDSDGEEAGFPLENRPDTSTGAGGEGGEGTMPAVATHLVNGVSYSHLALESFLTDMRVAMTLQHQNLVQLIGVTTHAPWGLCLALERMDFPLEACLDSDEWQVSTSLPRRLYILAQVADAISFMHCRGWRHQAITARNVLITMPKGAPQR